MWLPSARGCGSSTTSSFRRNASSGHAPRAEQQQQGGEPTPDSDLQKKPPPTVASYWRRFTHPSPWSPGHAAGLSSPPAVGRPARFVPHRRRLRRVPQPVARLRPSIARWHMVREAKSLPVASPGVTVARAVRKLASLLQELRAPEFASRRITSLSCDDASEPRDDAWEPRGSSEAPRGHGFRSRDGPLAARGWGVGTRAKLSESAGPLPPSAVQLTSPSAATSPH